MQVNRFSRCGVGDVPSRLELNEFKNPNKIKESIEAVREDHEETRILEDGVYILRFSWNDKRDAVQVSLYTYNGGFEPQDASSNSGDSDD
jgi:hypothetical protein